MLENVGKCGLGKVCSYVVGVDLRFNLRNSNSRANARKSVFCIVVSWTYWKATRLPESFNQRKSGRLLCAKSQFVRVGMAWNVTGVG